jgi:hypothetical protein
MKRIIAILLALTLVLSFAACQQQEETSFEDHFDSSTPSEMVDHTKILLERTDFDQYIENILNIQAYPDILMYNSDGSALVGMYIYDPETGLATGWTDLTTGEKHTFEAGKEVNLGKPDPEKMVQLDTIKLGITVYEKDDKVTGAELYFFLRDAKDGQVLLDFMRQHFNEPLVKESDTLYKIIKDENAVLADFAAEEKAGNAFFSKNAAEYITVLKLNYGVTLIEE